MSARVWVAALLPPALKGWDLSPSPAELLLLAEQFPVVVCSWGRALIREKISRLKPLPTLTQCQPVAHLKPGGWATLWKGYQGLQSQVEKQKNM